MANVIRGNISGPGVIGYLRGLCLGGPTSVNGDGNFGRHLIPNITESLTEGNPAVPSISIGEPGFWRFRWGVKTGVRTIRIDVKQVVNTNPRPTIVVKANAAIGVATDQTATAASSTGWTTIGPITITATADGVLWVELHNNCVSAFATPAFFDHIVAT